MPPLGTEVRDGQGMFCHLREVKEQEESGMVEVFNHPSSHPAMSPLNRTGVGWKGSCGLRGPHEHSSGAAHRAGCLGSAGGTLPAAAGL